MLSPTPRPVATVPAGRVDFFGEGRLSHPAFSAAAARTALARGSLEVLDAEFDGIGAGRCGDFVHEGFDGERVAGPSDRADAWCAAATSGRKTRARRAQPREDSGTCRAAVSAPHCGEFIDAGGIGDTRELRAEKVPGGGGSEVISPPENAREVNCSAVTSPCGVEPRGQIAGHGGPFGAPGRHVRAHPLHAHGLANFRESSTASAAASSYPGRP